MNISSVADTDKPCARLTRSSSVSLSFNSYIAGVLTPPEMATCLWDGLIITESPLLSGDLKSKFP